MPRPATPPYGERVLQIDPPCQGRDVWELQIKLIGWGSGSDPDGIGSPDQPVIVNGRFDVATRDAVKRFQHALTLPETGVVNEATFRAIDHEAALQPVLVWDMRCVCADGGNASAIPCRCNSHPSPGVCTGFGNARFSGQYLLDGITLPDGTSLAAEQLDVYDKREYPGVDKALIWAVRALMRRAPIARIKVAAGYRCWEDNYHHTDTRHWRHRQSTFHFGKTVEFYHDGTCAEWGQNRTAAPCGTCAGIRTVAIQKCGFQERWQQPDRVSVGQVARDVAPPSNPFAVMVSTVRRRDREVDEFVQTYHDSVKPLYPYEAPGYSYPMDLGAGYDVRIAPSAAFYANNENAAGGWYPMGVSRMWHGGIHLFAGGGTQVRAIADGEVVGFRAAEAETAKTLGSRNFVLIRHKLQNDFWYSLYMHLDAGVVNAASAVPWRKKVHAMTVDHAEILVPSPRFTTAMVSGASRLQAFPGFAAGERIATAGGAAAADPRTALDDKAPTNSQVIQIAAPPNSYVYVTMENENLARAVAADGGLAGNLAGNIVGLTHPVRVLAGEVIGYVGAAPTDAVLGPHGAFLHLETFSATQILTGAGYKVIDATADATALDRKTVGTKLKAAGLLDKLPDEVLLAGDLNVGDFLVNLVPMRSVVLRTRNQWQMDWKAALSTATSMSFMPDVARDAEGDKMNEYRWWADVDGNNRLPASPVVYHYHPLALLFHFAFPA